MSASIEDSKALQSEIANGNYSSLREGRACAHTVACMLKQVLREMGEPMCTYGLYIEFRDVNMLEQELRLQRVIDIF